MCTAANLQTWLALLDEGFATADGWSSWALRCVESAPSVRPWMVDMLDAPDRGAAIAAVADGLREMAPGVRPLDDASLRAGLLYLAHLRGRLPLSLVLLLTAGLRESVGVDPAYFLELADRAFDDAASITDVAARLFGPHAALARRCLSELATTTDPLDVCTRYP